MGVVLASRLLVASVVVVAGCGRIRFDPLAGDASVTPMLSCANLAPTCGPAGVSSCCGSSLVPGGTFYRGYDVGTDNMFTDMTNPATVSDFSSTRTR
jgi:hypothetical protein